METRSIKTQITGDGNTLSGYAAVFDAETRISEGGRTFTEKIKPGAFRNIGQHDVIATYNHDSNNLLGRTNSGTLRLSEDTHGLRFELTLPQSATVLRELVQRGDITGASFAFSVNPGGQQWDGSTRTLTDLRVYELGPVALPAYSQTSLALRDKQPDIHDESNQLKKLRLTLAEKTLTAAR